MPWAVLVLQNHLQAKTCVDHLHLIQISRLLAQLQQLLCSPHFQRVSGRHLAAAEMAFGFRFAALPGSWPCLQSLGDLIGLPRCLLRCDAFVMQP